ncbi:MAG: prolipoprotein diacylglyceryl transferase [Proteobacteria bacterium]|nr:prolipoprotein diacylglyceryl transferase [Pseudomonadota bacterium]
MSLPCLREIVPVEGFFGLPIRPFGLLVSTGVMIGYSLARRRARATGLDEDVCANAMVWSVVAGFIGAHWVSVIFYFPEDLRRDPWVLLKFWKQLSSFGGFVGGALGAWLYFRRQRQSLLKYADAIIFGLVPGWFFGRLGCTVVHDHPGAETSFALGVRCGTGGAVVHDLGLYEALFTVVLVGVLYGLRRLRPFHGFPIALMLALYAPVRFLLDRLRIEDRTYWGLTPGQFFAGLVLLLAAALAAHGLHLRRQGDWPGAPASERSLGGRGAVAAAPQARQPARRRRRRK